MAGRGGQGKQSSSYSIELREWSKPVYSVWKRGSKPSKQLVAPPHDVNVKASALANSTTNSQTVAFTPVEIAPVPIITTMTGSMTVPLAKMIPIIRSPRLTVATSKIKLPIQPALPRLLPRSRVIGGYRIALLHHPQASRPRSLLHHNFLLRYHICTTHSRRSHRHIRSNPRCCRAFQAPLVCLLSRA